VRVDLRKRQIIEALEDRARAIEEQGTTVGFEGQLYEVVPYYMAADTIYVLKKAAAWMLLEEAEDGTKAAAEAEGVLR
jgi:hypothetical protein